MESSLSLADDVTSVRRFNRFYTRAIGLLKRGLLDSEFTLTEVRVLYELAHAAPPGDAGVLTAAELRQLLDLDASYLSRILRNFEARGLIAKSASPADGRASHIRLTAQGRAAFAPLDEASGRETLALLSNLSPNARARMIAAMRQIETALSRPSTSAHAECAEAFRLRAHRPGDIGWVIQRHGELYALEYGWDERFDALVAEICATFIHRFDPERERCWIAENDTGRLGCVFLVKKSATTAKLRMLLVEPGARGLGLGKRLVDECLNFARSAGYKKVTLWTNDILHAARHIYVERGFKIIREERHHSFGHDLVGQHWDLKL